VCLVGLGGHAEQEGTEVEFGLAEEVAIVLGDEQAGHLEQLVRGGLLELLGELSSFGFLFGAEFHTHGILPVAKVDFFPIRPLALLCTKILPTMATLTRVCVVNPSFDGKPGPVGVC
jgi:hypothetical protein